MPLHGARLPLATGLREIYVWYERNAALLAAVQRDAEHHELTRETSELRYGPTLARWNEVLGGVGLSKGQHALLMLALSFHTWKTLTSQAGFGTEAAGEVMVQTVWRA